MHNNSIKRDRDSVAMCYCVWLCVSVCERETVWALGVTILFACKNFATIACLASLDFVSVNTFFMPWLATMSAASHIFIAARYLSLYTFITASMAGGPFPLLVSPCLVLVHAGPISLTNWFKFRNRRCWLCRRTLFCSLTSSSAAKFLSWASSQDVNKPKPGTLGGLAGLAGDEGECGMDRGTSDIDSLGRLYGFPEYCSIPSNELGLNCMNHRFMNQCHA